MSVFFGVDEGDAAMKRAADQGYGCVNALDYTQEEINQHLGGLFDRYQEFNLDSYARCGFAVSLARIDDKPVPPWSADLTAWHLGQAWGVSTQEAATLLSENSHRLLAIMKQR